MVGDYELWWTSGQAASEGATDALVMRGAALYKSQALAYSPHTLVFAAGATIVYVPFARSGLLSRPSTGLGLIAAPLGLVSQALVVLRVDVPPILFLPNLPVELGAGLWLATCGRPATTDG